MFRNKKIEVLIRGILVLFRYGCIDSSGQVVTIGDGLNSYALNTCGLVNCFLLAFI